MNDIQDEQDIELLINLFYKKVVVNPVIGHFFTDVVNLSWDIHIPVMISFWCTTLLGAATYKGNPMVKHFELDKLARLEKQHFDEWLMLWNQTVIENFTGAKATEAITRAEAIAALMQFKVEQSRMNA